MCALAIHGTRIQTLIMVQDRFVIKQLLYAPKSERLMFASKIRVLLC